MYGIGDSVERGDVSKTLFCALGRQIHDSM
jgi:hypothetical protein